MRWSFYIFCLLCCVALIAPFLPIQNPYNLAELDLMNSFLEPFSYENNYLFILGTDEMGRDLLSAILYGLRLSLLIGLLSGGIAFIIGCSLGIVSAYYGGFIDRAIMRLVDVMLSLPTILIALFLIAFLGKGIDKIILALVIVQWASFARTSRAIASVEMKKPYILAAKLLQYPPSRIIFFELLPNCLSPLKILAISQISGAIGLEATLSFFGLGLPITQPSLGLLIGNGFDHLYAGYYWLALFPGIVLMIIIFVLNYMNFSLKREGVK